MRRITTGLVLGALTILLGLWAAELHACPFCTAVSQTFTEEITSMDAVVIARLIEAPPVPDSSASDPDAPLPKATFRVEQVVKGDEWIRENGLIEVLYFGDADREKRYLIMGTDPPQVMWSTPLGLSERAHKYVLSLPKLPEGADRLKFFQEHLEDPDEMLARDAYDEFANAPYEHVQALKDHMHHDRLIKWIKDADIPASRRRLYFTMLGVCGKPEDAALLESMMKSDDRKQKAGLDALIACYLLLRGAEGLEIVDQLFLKNADSDYADTYAAIMAIRFHGNEVDVIDKQRLVESLRHMLDRPELADLVIPDLARWNDWEVMPRLVKLFKNADDKSSWVRVPVINYLRACPLPEAKEKIEELSKIDPEAVKRAQTFFPFDATGEGTTEEAKSKPNETSSLSPSPALEVPRVAAESAVNEPDSIKMVSHVDATSAAEPPDSAESAGSDATTVPEGANVSAATTAASAAPGYGADFDSAEAGDAAWRPNRMQVCGVPILAGVILFAIYRAVIGH